MSEASHDTVEDTVGSVTFVAAGPGDPTLLTVAGKRALRHADHLIVDDQDLADGLASAGIWCPDEVSTVVEDQREEPAQLMAAARQGRKVVRLTRGDFYSQRFHNEVLPAVLSEHTVRTHVIPGVSRWGAVLTYGAVAPTRVFACVNATHGFDSDEEWPDATSVIVWTKPEHLRDVAERGAGIYGGGGALLEICHLGNTAQSSSLTTWDKLIAGGSTADDDVYLVVGPGIGQAARQRVDWFESKPLFDWDVLVPRTKDDVEELTEQLARYGAGSEVVPTLSIEPPRTEQGMEKAVRGLVDGRYLWLVFTSPHSVRAVMDRLAEYGLDSRAMSGINIAAVGRGTAESLRRVGIRPDLVPQGDETVSGLAGEFPAFDDMIDPLNRVLIPSADVSVAPLVEGLGRLGWEAEEVTAYRTVRASPPPADVRDKIKTGQFDAVVFTSSTAVRNLIGIAGKPHALSVIAAIGPATAQTCEMHGLRVDLIADAPSFESLAEGLARFADQRRERLEQAGQPVAKPSSKRRRRKK